MFRNGWFRSPSFLTLVHLVVKLSSVSPPTFGMSVCLSHVLFLELSHMKFGLEDLQWFQTTLLKII